MIRLLKRKQIGQAVREDGPRSHMRRRARRPWRRLILLAVIAATLLWRI